MLIDKLIARSYLRTWDSLGRIKCCGDATFKLRAERFKYCE